MNENKLNISLPSYVIDVMERVETSGEEIYVVGGSLRDAVMGKAPNDYDLATSASPEKIIALFSDRRVIETGIKHGTVTVMSKGHPLEITTFRIDGDYKDSRHPESVSFTRSISEDLSRRDFTVNAMAYSPVHGFVDPFFGRQDIESRVLRAVGDSRLRFSEDALRIMRLFRFSAQLGFSIETETLLGATEKRNGLLYIARERIATELLKLLTSPDPRAALYSMIACGVLSTVTGGYVPIEQTVEALALMDEKDYSRLGLFFADTDGETARDIINSLKLSNKQKTGALCVLRATHECPRDEAACRRFRGSFGVYFAECAMAAYLLGGCTEEARTYIISCHSPMDISELDISGKELIALGLSGREIGETLDYLFSLVMDDPSLNEKKKLTALIRKKQVIK